MHVALPGCTIARWTGEFIVERPTGVYDRPNSEVFMLNNNAHMLHPCF